MSPEELKLRCQLGWLLWIQRISAPSNLQRCLLFSTERVTFEVGFLPCPRVLPHPLRLTLWGTEVSALS